MLDRPIGAGFRSHPFHLPRLIGALTQTLQCREARCGADRVRRSGRHCLRLRNPLVVPLLALGVTVAGALAAPQIQAAQNAPETQKQAIQKTDLHASFPPELQKRAAAVQAAQQTGDPAHIAQASRALIAAALRQMAHLRRAEGAFPAAIELYQKSLALEDNSSTRIELAIAYLRAKRVSEALTESAKVVQANPTDPRARADRDAGDLADAVGELKIALRISPDTPHAHYLLGLVYLLQEEGAPRPEIREEFLRELQINPNDFLSTYLLGSMASPERKFEESDRYLKRATTLNPSWPEPWIYLGLNANSQGDTKGAEEFLRKGIALTGTDYSRSNYFVRKAYFMLGRLLLQGENKEEASGYLEKAKELEGQVQKDNLIAGVPGGGTGSAAEVHAATNDIKKEEEDRIEPALQPRDSTVKLDASALARPNPSGTEKTAALAQEKQLRTVLGASYNDLATSEAVRRQYASALTDYLEAERWDPKLPALMRNLGITAAHAQSYAESIRTLPEVLAADPKDQTVRAVLGVAYYMKDQYQQAAQTLSPLADAAFKDPDVGYAWADSLVHLRDEQGASAVLDKLERVPLPIETRMRVGQSWERMDHHLRAVQSYHKVLETSPTQPKAHYYAGLAYIHADRPADAANEFKAELSITPDDPDAQYSLGFVDLEITQRAEAAALFQSVVTSHPEHADAQYELGKFLLEDHRVREAIPHLEAAVRLKPQADYMHYQLQTAYRRDARFEDAERELAIYEQLKARKREQLAPKPD
jgi:tetratricopeptide (TPR) repeat protein